MFFAVRKDLINGTGAYDLPLAAKKSSSSDVLRRFMQICRMNSDQ